MDKRKILLVDGNSLIYRAFFASLYGHGMTMRTTSGIPTNAVYSFANMLLSLVNRGDYYAVYVAFDKGKHTFRHDIMPDYKGGRNPTPEDLIKQFPIAREFLDALNIKYYEMDNIEADDLIGTMSALINKEEPADQVDILSGDKDMFQLISNNTFVQWPKSGTSNLEEITPEQLKIDMGLTPDQIKDYKGLCGDSSDNLPGVKGIGKIGATKLIQQYGSLENIYDHIDEIKGATHDKLVAGKDSAFLCKQLATIKRDVEIPDFEIKRIDITTDKLIAFLEKYQFKSLITRFTNVSEHINNDIKIEWQSLPKWSAYYEDEENDLYVESLDSDYHNATVLGIAVHSSKGNIFLNTSNKKQLDIFNVNDEQSVGVDEAFNEFLKSNKKKNTYDVKKTLALLESLGYEPNPDSFTYDMEGIGYLLNPSIKSTFANHLRLIDPSLNIEDDDEFYGKGAKVDLNMSVDKKGEFICKKAYYIGATKQKGIEEITKLDELNTFELIDLPLNKVLKNMEDHGVLIDIKELDEQTKNAQFQMDKAEQEFKDKAKGYIDEDFNIASPKQISELFFNKLQLPDYFKGSTNAQALEAIAGYHELPAILLEYRKWAKLYGTYLEGFKKYITKEHRIHTIFNQNLTATGRLSSMEPNFQNTTVRDDDQKESRKIFIADQGFTFYSFDYSQVELRVMAQMADEKHMIDIFKRNGDIHTESAMKIFDITDANKVTKEQRRTAKVFNFGIIYGLTPYGLSQDLNIGVGEAKDLIDKYYKEFPDIKAFQDRMINDARTKGYAETLSHRKRYTPELNSSSKRTQTFGERIAVNMPVQGTAADILKIAMIDIYNEFKANNYESYMDSQIHDEIIFAIKDGEEDKVIPIIKDKMSNAFAKLLKEFQPEMKLEVPLIMSESSGKNWFELK